MQLAFPYRGPIIRCIMLNGNVECSSYYRFPPTQAMASELCSASVNLRMFHCNEVEPRLYSSLYEACLGLVCLARTLECWTAVRGETEARWGLPPMLQCRVLTGDSSSPMGILPTWGRSCAVHDVLGLALCGPRRVQEIDICQR